MQMDNNRSEPNPEQVLRLLSPEQVLRFVSSRIESFASEGRDLCSEARLTAQAHINRVRKRGGDWAIETLCKAGCNEGLLNAALSGSILLNSLQTLCYGTTTYKRRSIQMSKTYESAARFSDTFLPGLSTEWPSGTTLPSPQEMADYSRAYALLNDSCRSLLEAMKSNLIDERFAITKYAHDSTREWHDIEVSVIISASSGKPLDEETHGRWRRRNSKKINSFPLEMLVPIARLLGLEQDKN